MPKRFRLTRRFPVAMTEDGYRRLKTFAKEAGLDEGEALSFLFENYSQRHQPRQPDPPPAPVQFGTGCAQMTKTAPVDLSKPPAGVFGPR